MKVGEALSGEENGKEDKVQEYHRTPDHIGLGHTTNY